MIYTLTLNPAIDYILSIPSITVGKTNYAEQSEISFGGKGINVSKTLQTLGVDNTALGFAFGSTGKMLIEGINIPNSLIYSPTGNTRINVKLNSKQETEINALGSIVPPEMLEKLFSQLQALKPYDTLFISGSVPPNLGDSIYSKIIASITASNVRIIVDTTNKLLLNTLKHKPFLIKPNLSELEQIFSTKTKNSEDIITLAKKLQNLGAQNILVSLGSAGALLLTANNIYKQTAPKGTAINTVGSGDSMLAGFIYYYDIYNDFEKALKFAVATGSATAFTSGIATKSEITELFSSL